MNCGVRHVSPQWSFHQMTFISERLNRQLAELADRLRAEAEAAGSRYAQGLCGHEEYKSCLDRFSRLILHGKAPVEDTEFAPD
jgi:hypothetical protein